MVTGNLMEQPAGLSSFERNLFHPEFRVVLVGLGVICLIGSLRVIARAYGHGRPISLDEVAARAYRGDLARARSAVRAVFPAQSLGVTLGAFLVTLGLLDPANPEPRTHLLLGFLASTAVLCLWFWSEFELAWPGVLVPRGVRRTPGMRQVRRTSRRS